MATGTSTIPIALQAMQQALATIPFGSQARTPATAGLHTMQHSTWTITLRSQARPPATLRDINMPENS